MANISQNVNIEMLEKLPDGTYKRKYPKTRSDDGTTFDEHLADDATQAHLAKNIRLEDVGGNFTATDLEGGMDELFTNVSNGKLLLETAITDKNGVVSKTEVTPTFNELKSGVLSIPQWAEIKSIQSGEAFIGHNSSTLEVDINIVDVNKTILIFSFASSSSDNFAVTFVHGELHTDGTKIKFRRRSSGGSVSMSYFVVEFNSGVKVQHVYGSGTNASIEPVDINKTFLISSVLPTTNSTTLYYYIRRAHFINNSTVKLSTSGSYDTSVDYHIQAIEFVG